MILEGIDSAGSGPGATLDELFRRAGVRRPDALALADAPNRAGLDGTAPRRLTFAQADRAISALAARLRRLGLPTDAVVALQMPNTVDAVVALLGVMRAGMIAAPLPLLWRQFDIVSALKGLGTKAIIADSAAQAHTAMLAAAELFPIRHVCGFGDGLPDGVLPLETVFAEDAHDFVQTPVRIGQAAGHAAVVTFDIAGDGIAAVARNHVQLIAGGLVPFLEAGLAQDAKILSAIPPASFAGLTLTLVPWLIAGGSLELVHGGDAQALAAQCRVFDGDALVVPGPALKPLASAGAFDGAANILALWRAPERLVSAAPWQEEAALIDVAAFGEVGLLAARRGADGKPASLTRGSIEAPRGAAGAARVLEAARGKTGTLLLRGPMVPGQAFPPGADEDRRPHIAPDAAGFVDTGYACRDDGDELLVTAPPAGLASIGGYRFRQPALDALVQSLDPAATLLAVPDAIMGERLAASAPDPAAARAQLRARGVNPLICEAFRPRAA